MSILAMNFKRLYQHSEYFFNLLTPLSEFLPLSSCSRDNSHKFASECTCPPKSPVKIEHVVSKTRQKQMDLVGHKPYIPCPCSGSIRMQAEYPKYLLYLGSHAREDAVPSLLSTTQAPIAPGLGQNSVKLSFLTILLLERFFIISLVRKYGLLIALHNLIHHLRIVHVGRRANKFRDKLRFRINGNMVLVAVDNFIFPFSERGIIIFAGLSRRLDQTSIDNFASLELKAYLALELIEASAIKVHKLEVGAEAGDSKMMGTGSTTERPRKRR